MKEPILYPNRNLMNLKLLILAVLLSFTQLSLMGQSLKKKGDTAKGEASYYHSKFHGRKTASGEIYDKFKLTAAHRTLPYGTMIKVTNLRNRRSIVIKVNDRGPYAKGRIVDLSFAAASKIDMIKEGVATVEVEIISMPGEKTDDTKEEEPVVKKEEPKKTETPKKTDTKKRTAVGSILKNAKDMIVTALDRAFSKEQLEERFKSGKSYDINGDLASPNGYGIQLASYFDPSYALKVAREAADLGLNPTVVQSGWQNGKRIYRVLYGSETDIEKMKGLLPMVKSKGFNGFVKKHF